MNKNLSGTGAETHEHDNDFGRIRSHSILCVAYSPILCNRFACHPRDVEDAVPAGFLSLPASAVSVYPRRPPKPPMPPGPPPKPP